MARRSMSLLGVVVTGVALGVLPQGAVAAPVPPRDFVVGSGERGSFFQEISISADSAPLGDDPSGSVSFVAEIVVGGSVARVTFSGPVTCLAVHGNRAVIGFLAFIGPMKVVVVDNGSTGSPADEFGAVPFAGTNCSDETGVGVLPLTSGDIVVRDAPSKAQCRDDGWRNYADAAGQPFGNQGECIAFARGVT